MGNETMTTERAICEAASDYKLALENEDFAKFIGGIEAAQAELFRLVVEWEDWDDEVGQ